MAMTTKEDIETPIQLQEHSAYTDMGLNTGPQTEPTLGPAWGGYHCSEFSQVRGQGLYLVILPWKSPSQTDAMKTYRRVGYWGIQYNSTTIFEGFLFGGVVVRTDLRVFYLHFKCLDYQTHAMSGPNSCQEGGSLKIFKGYK